MHRFSYCKICNRLSKIVSFRRDDPVLSCGHVKTVSKDSKVEDCQKDVEAYVKQQSRTTGLPPELIRRALLGTALKMSRSHNVAYCPICDMTVSTVVQNGHRICAGNLYDNPGCGCKIKETKVDSCCIL